MVTDSGGQQIATGPQVHRHVLRPALRPRQLEDRLCLFQYGCGSKPMGSHFGVGAPPILEPIFLGIGMFTGGERNFDPWPYGSIFWRVPLVWWVLEGNQQDNHQVNKETGPYEAWPKCPRSIWEATPGFATQSSAQSSAHRKPVLRFLNKSYEELPTPKKNPPQIQVKQGSLDPPTSE